MDTNTRDLLDAVKRKYALTSDYQLGQHLSIDRAQISLYRNARRTLTERDAGQVADALNTPLSVILAIVALERARTEPGRKAWRDAVKRLGGVAASVALLLGGGPTPPSAGAASTHAETAQPLCIMSTRKRRRPASPWDAASNAARRLMDALIPASCLTFA